MSTKELEKTKPIPLPPGSIQPQLAQVVTTRAPAAAEPKTNPIRIDLLCTTIFTTITYNLCPRNSGDKNKANVNLGYFTLRLTPLPHHGSPRKRPDPTCKTNPIFMTRRRYNYMQHNHLQPECPQQRAENQSQSTPQYWVHRQSTQYRSTQEPKTRIATPNHPKQNGPSASCPGPTVVLSLVFCFRETIYLSRGPHRRRPYLER